MPDVFNPVPPTKPAKSLAGKGFGLDIPSESSPPVAAPAQPASPVPTPIAPSAPIPPTPAVVPQEPVVQDTTANPLFDLEASVTQGKPAEVPPTASGAFEAGPMGQVDQAVGYTNRLTIGATKSLFHMDPRYVMDAAKGYKVDFDKDIDNLINGADPSFWSPVAGLLRSAGPHIGLGDTQHTEQVLGAVPGIAKGVLKTAASFFDLGWLTPLALEKAGVKYGAPALLKAAKIVEEVHPANLLVKTPLLVADKVAKTAIEGVSKAVGSSLVEDAAKAYERQSHGLGTFGALGGMFGSKAVVNTPQILSYGMSSGFNNRALSEIAANFTKSFGYAGSFQGTRDFFERLNRGSDPKLMILQFGQDWNDLGRGVGDALVKKGFTPIEAQNLIADIATARMGPIDKKLSQVYPNAYATVAPGKNINSYMANQQTSLKANIEAHYDQLEQSIAQRALAKGVTEEELGVHAAKISQVVNKYEDSLVSLSQTVGQSTGKPSKTIADFFDAHNAQSYRLLTDFDMTLQKLGAKGPDLAGMGAEEATKALETHLSTLSPVQIESLIQSGAVARLPLLTDEMARIIVDKASSGAVVSDAVRGAAAPIANKNLEKTLAAEALQKEVFLHNPQVAYERSMNTMRKELQNSKMVDNIPSQGALGGWAIKDASLVSKGYQQFNENYLQLLGPKGEQLRGLYIHPQAKAMLENMIDFHTDPEKITGILKYLYPVTNSWKQGVLSSPATVMNNAFGNAMQAELGKTDPRNFAATISALKAFAENPTEAYKTNPWIKAVIDQEVMTPDFYKDVLAKRGPNIKGNLSKALPAMDSGLVPKGIVESANSINSVTDEFFKIAMFMSQKQLGVTDEQAAKHVFKFYYNGSQASKLTPSERSFLVPLIPFWRWMKNNVPGQVNNLATNSFSTLRQIELYHRLGLADDTFIANPRGSSTSIGYVSDDGNVNYTDKSSAIPAMDLQKIAGGLQQLSQGHLMRALSEGVGIGPQQGVSPLLTLPAAFTAAEDKSIKGQDKGKVLFGQDVSSPLQVLITAVPGLRALDILTRGTGIAGSGPSQRGINPKAPGTPGILGGLPTVEAKRTAKEELANFLGSPTMQALTFKQVGAMPAKGRASIAKALLSKVGELKQRGMPKEAAAMQNYGERMKSYVEALAAKEQAHKEHPRATESMKDAPLDDLLQIKLDKLDTTLQDHDASFAKDEMTTLLKDKQGGQ